MRYAFLVVFGLFCLTAVGCGAMQLTEAEIERSNRLGGKISETQFELEAVYAEIKKAKEDGLIDSLPALLQKSIALQDDIRMYQKDLTDIYNEAKKRSDSPWNVAGNLLMQFIVGLVAYATGHKGRKTFMNPPA